MMGRLVEAAMGAPDPLAMLRTGSVAYLDIAANDEVRRICLLDAPAVLAPDVRRDLSERFGLGVIRETLRECMDAGLIAEQPVEALARLFMAMLLEAATMIAEGADRDEVATAFTHFMEAL